MKKVLETMLVAALFLWLISFSLTGRINFYADAAQTLENKTFAWDAGDNWDQVTPTYFELFIGTTSGGTYAKVGEITYQDASDESGFQSPPLQITVTGQPYTHETRYFVLNACGEVPTETGGTELKCSGYSNETSYSFWIQGDGFSAPVNFIISSD